METTVIRRATRDDFDAIARLNREVQEKHARAYPGLFKPASDDHFSFAIERTAKLDQLVEEAAVRYHVRADLAGRLFEEFLLDVGFDFPKPGRPWTRISGAATASAECNDY